MVVTHFKPRRHSRETALLFPESWWHLTMWGSRPSHFYDNPEYKRHPNNTKTDQLPISEVITGLPRPYHNTSPPWWAAYAEYGKFGEIPVPLTRPWIEDAALVVVFALNRSFHRTTSAVPPVSFLIVHFRDTNYVVTNSETKKNQTLKNQGRQIKC